MPVKYDRKSVMQINDLIFPRRPSHLRIARCKGLNYVHRHAWGSICSATYSINLSIANGNFRIKEFTCLDRYLWLLLSKTLYVFYGLYAGWAGWRLV